MKFPRSPHDEVLGLVYFGRMLDKIRLHAAGELPPGYNLGTKNWFFFDARCVRFLGVSYAALRRRTLAGGTDEQVLRWCWKTGRRPRTEEVDIWNTFMRKRGWNDSVSEGVDEEKAVAGLTDRADLVTFFDVMDAEEGRKVRRGD